MIRPIKRITNLNDLAPKESPWNDFLRGLFVAAGSEMKVKVLEREIGVRLLGA